MKIRAGQYYQDKRTGNILFIRGKHHDRYWNAILIKSGKGHKMTEWSLQRYWIPAYNPNALTPADNQNPGKTPHDQQLRV